MNNMLQSDVCSKINPDVVIMPVPVNKSCAFNKMHPPIKDRLLIDRVTGDLYSATDGTKVPNIISTDYMIPQSKFITQLHNTVKLEMAQSAINDPDIKALRYSYFLQTGIVNDCDKPLVSRYFL